MAEESIGGLIDSRIDFLIDQIPVNYIVVAKKNYVDNHVDVEIVSISSLLKYVPCNSPPKVGDEGILIFLEGNLNKPYCIFGDTNQKILFPKKCEISNVYNNGLIDIRVDDTTIEKVECLGEPTINHVGILVFLNNNIEDYIVIC